MKTIYLIGGTMGVGKTTVSQQLKKELPNSVFLDGDWCWDADPFQVTEETKAMVMRNICFLLNSFLHCTAYKNIIFCWVMHEQSIINEIINSLLDLGGLVREQCDAGIAYLKNRGATVRHLERLTGIGRGIIGRV